MDNLTDKEKSKLCLKCFYCCNYIYIPIDAGLGLIHFLRSVRGIEIQFVGINLQPYAIIKQPCQYLTSKGCSIYKNRPIDCKEYDGRKDLFHREKCLWTQEELKRGGNTI